MKQLLILRHADAAHLPQGRDFDRPLSAAGQAAALRIANQIRESALIPDTILCSSARRTRETAVPILKLQPGLPVRYEQSLYEASAGAIYEHIRKTAGTRCLMMIGHNPGLSEVVRFLAGSGAPDLLGKVRSGLQTGMMVVLACPCPDWDALMPAANEVTQVFRG